MADQTGSIVSGAGSILSGLGQIIDPNQTSNAPNTPIPSNSQANVTGGAAPVVNATGSNTLLYIGLGVVVVAVVAYFALK